MINSKLSLRRSEADAGASLDIYQFLRLLSNLFYPYKLELCNCLINLPILILKHIENNSVNLSFIL